MADKAHTKTDQKLEEMERHLFAIYSRAKKEVGETWTQYMKESAKELEELQEAYDIAKKSGDRDEIKRTGKALGRTKREVTIKNKHYKALTESLAREISHTNETAVAYINDQLPEVYALNYNALKDSVDGVGGYVFELVDADTVKHLALTDKSLLPYKKIDLRKDIPWNMKKINAEVLQGVLQGESMDKIAKRIGNVQEMNKNASIRTARTIVTGAENKGRQDSYARAEADGIILQKEWLATNDGRTRHSHAALDGAIVDQDKKFDNGLMYPGDPSGRPEEVYNCRCTLVAKVNGFKKVQVQKAMAEKQVEEQPTIRKPEEYTDSASIDKRLAELQKEWDSSTDFNRWVEIEKEQTALTERKKNLLQQESKARAQEIQRRIYEKDYFATKGIGRGYAVDLDGLDEESMLDVERAMDSIFVKFPSLKNKFPGISVADDLPDGAMASCGRSFGKVSLSRSYFENNGKISAAWKRCIENGLHPVGTRSHSAIVHEFGHSVDHLITRKGDMFDPKYIGKDATASTLIKKSVYKKLGISDGDVASGLSSYATMNDKEFVAEAFAEYVTSPAPRPIAVAVGEEIEKMLGGLL